MLVVVTNCRGHATSQLLCGCWRAGCCTFTGCLLSMISTSSCCIAVTPLHLTSSVSSSPSGSCVNPEEAWCAQEAVPGAWAGRVHHCSPQHHHRQPGTHLSHISCHRWVGLQAMPGADSAAVGSKKAWVPELGDAQCCRCQVASGMEPPCLQQHGMRRLTYVGCRPQYAYTYHTAVRRVLLLVCAPSSRQGSGPCPLVLQPAPTAPSLGRGTGTSGSVYH